MLLIILACLIPTYLTAKPELFTYKVIDGLNLQAAVYTPTTIRYERYPVIFLIHGGGFLLGDCTKDAISGREIDEILSRGWAIVSVDYRLAPYTFLPDAVQDIIDAYNWVRKDLANTFLIDRDAIAVWGNSAGGGLAVIAGYKFTPRPKVIVSLYPYCTDFTGSYIYNPATPVSQGLIEKANSFRQPKSKASTSEDIGTRWPFFLDMQAEQKAGWVITTSDPDESPDDIMNTLREYSAIYHIDKEYPPTYLIHGDKDELVPISQSVEMAKVLKDKQVTYELDIVPGAPHAFELFYEVPEEAWQKHLEPIFKFVDKHVGKSYWLGEPETIKLICIHAIVVIIIIITGYLMKRKDHYIRLEEGKALAG